MKPGDIARKLGELGPLLANLGAKDSAVRLSEVVEFVGASQLKSIGELVKKIALVSCEKKGSEDALPSSGVALLNLAKVLEAGGGTKVLIADLRLLGEALGKPDLQAFTFPELGVALDRIRPPAQSGKGLRTELVIAYLRRLEAALGESEFHEIYAELKADKSMRQGEVAALASAFMSKGPAKEARTSALNRILARHQNLESIAGRNRAGRAAA